MDNTRTLRKLLQIFWSFFKIGPITFGGGYAMIPLIEREVVDRRKWVESEDIADIFAISESIPGAIAINSSTFVGYRIAGLPGAIAALLGIVLPTFFIVIGLCIAFLHVQDNPKIAAAFEGIRAATVALICYAAIKIGKTAVLDKTTFGTMIATVAILLIAHMNPIIIIVAGALAGIVMTEIKKLLGIKVHLAKEHNMEYRYADYYIGDGI